MINLGIIVRDTGEVAGSIGLVLKPEHDKAEIGYWIGVPYWGRGYATEAARAMIDYGFRECKLNRIDGGRFGGNQPAGVTNDIQPVTNRGFPPSNGGVSCALQNL